LDDEDAKPLKGGKKSTAEDKVGGKRKRKDPAASTTGAAAGLKKPKIEGKAEQPVKKEKEKLLVSEQSVTALLARKGQLPIVTLLGYFKEEVTGDSPANKQKKRELSVILKKVAIMKEIPPGSGNKVLVLKDARET